MDIKKILELHKMWLNNEEGGECANFQGKELENADFRGADLFFANFSGADLRGANFSGADLRRADFSNANLSHSALYNTDLRDAKLTGVNLFESNMHYANLCEADLRGAKTENVKYNESTAFFALQCPEEGPYIGYKKAGGLIVKLEITSDALRSSATTRKCRASKAKVLDITNIEGDIHYSSVASDHDSNFVYVVGETVCVEDFDKDRWNECSTGIHHFITRQEAVNY